MKPNQADAIKEVITEETERKGYNMNRRCQSCGGSFYQGECIECGKRIGGTENENRRI